MCDPTRGIGKVLMIAMEEKIVYLVYNVVFAFLRVNYDTRDSVVENKILQIIPTTKYNYNVDNDDYDVDDANVEQVIVKDR
ncbi:hypothetical protein T03_7483 [Trichinella britovi]|uniref:Uncharacterized protein n=2 Tax=Trichinella TaxID=6333 RepID=A0A0V1D0L1_TRIBR|nr:hypothetical protein T05_5846 [Trichinella murrelli]KRY54531.1 hypothetical protein T03_7483 [Trichinella britovi]